MRPEKRLRVEYAKTTETTESTEVTSEAAASDDVVLLALDAIADENGERSRLYEVDRARWAASGAMRIARGRTLIQPFSTGAGRVHEIHLLLDTFSDRCALQVDVVRPSSTGFPVRVAGGVMRCRGGTVMAYRSVVLDQPLAPHSDYALHVNATANDPLPGAIRYGPLAAAVGDGDGASDAWAPFRIDGEPASPPCALAIRLVTKRLE